MKLWYKLLVSTLLIWIIFLVAIFIIFYPLVPPSYLYATLIIGFICWGALFIILKKLYIDRLVHLNKQLLRDKPQVLLISGTDEISTMVASINTIIEQLLSFEEKLTHRWRDRDQSFSIAEQALRVDKDRLAHLAHYDSLTTLPNRIFFNEMLNKSLQHAHRQNKKLAILFVDIDRFKQINDSVGYKKGNKILKEIATRLSSVLRSGDIIARLGGDEFVILLNDISHPKSAGSIADKILRAAAQKITFEDQDFYISVSIGICIFPDEATSLETLQKNADLALYKAKCAGGGIYHYFTNEMTLEANKHIKLDKALRKAILNEEFILHFQPKLNLKTGTITGVEALIRWINPDIGIINPIDFIPQAEESGLIMQIGEWVLREACHTSKSWQDQGFEPISMAVNLSPQQFSNPELVNIIDSVIKETGLNPNLLELEITETSIIENINLTVEKLLAIKAMGVKVCIDDFGTGYTSINFLRKFPIDVLKVDQIFVKGIPLSQNDVAITSAIIALAHSLGIEVVAEGVETLEQLDFLITHHCDLIQGYYFSRPLPEAKVILQLRKRK